MMSKKSPQLRFEGFTDDWEKRKLGELALVLTGFPFKNEDFVDNGKYLVIINKSTTDFDNKANLVINENMKKIFSELH